MDFKKPDILFRLIYAGKEYSVQTYKDQYYSLMVLIADYTGMAGFGICSGMGSCGTCRVGMHEACNNNERSVLSCDIKIDDVLSNSIIVVPENDY